jgi:hypothetical protein
MTAPLMQGSKLNVDQYDSVWKFYQTNCVALHCARIVKNSVLAAGVQSLHHTSSDSQLYVFRHLETFARSSFDWLTCIGIIPVTIRYHSCISQFLPEVPVYSAVSIHTSTSKLGQTMFTATLSKGYDLMGGRNDDTVHVWSGSDNIPTSTGQVVTPLSALEGSQRLVQFWIQRTKVAFKLLSNPFMVTQSRPSNNSDVDGVVWNTDEATAVAAETARVSRLEEIADHQRTVRASAQPDWGECNNDDPDLEQECRPREYYLPEDRDSVQPPVPHVPADLLSIMRYADERTYAAFGVPPSMFTTSGQTVSNRSEVVGIFRGQVRRMRRLIESCMNDSMSLCRSNQAGVSSVWTIPEGRDEQAPGSNRRAKRRQDTDRWDAQHAKRRASDWRDGDRLEGDSCDGDRRGSDLCDGDRLEGDSYDRRDRAPPREVFTLASVSCASPEEAIAWHQLGFLTFEEADNCIRIYAGLPPAAPSHKRDRALSRVAVPLPERTTVSI